MNITQILNKIQTVSNNFKLNMVFYDTSVANTSAFSVVRGNEKYLRHETEFVLNYSTRGQCNKWAFFIFTKTRTCNKTPVLL